MSSWLGRVFSLLWLRQSCFRFRSLRTCSGIQAIWLCYSLSVISLRQCWKLRIFLMDRRWLFLRLSFCSAFRLKMAWGMRFSSQVISFSFRSIVNFLRLLRVSRRVSLLCRLSRCRCSVTSVILVGILLALFRRDSILSCFSFRRFSRVVVRVSFGGKSFLRCSFFRLRSLNIQRGISRSFLYLIRMIFRRFRRKICEEKGSLAGEWSRLSFCRCISCERFGGKVMSQMVFSRSVFSSLSLKIVSGRFGSMQRVSSSRFRALRCSFCRSFSGVYSWFRLSCFRRFSLILERKIVKRLEQSELYWLMRCSMKAKSFLISGMLFMLVFFRTERKEYFLRGRWKSQYSVQRQVSSQTYTKEMQQKVSLENRWVLVWL